MILACALGVREPVLTAETSALLKEARPWGLILFREACKTPMQVRALTEDLREACGHDAIVWIDQEGGRVARLKPPSWPLWPAALRYGALYEKDPEAGLEAAWLGHRLIAHELKAIGVNGDFAPVLDVPADGSDPIIGDRAFGLDAHTAALLGGAALQGLREGGVAGCVKHIPGHGRADVDSHIGLPRVGEGMNALAIDIAPFRALTPQAEAAMTAHIVYAALDPTRPATQSPIVIDFIRNDIGFQGLLISDDLDMNALSGTLAKRAAAAFDAGCDLVIQCSGVASDMALTAEAAPALQGEALARAQLVEAVARQSAGDFDAAEAWWRFRALMGADVGLKLA
ncbi:MAG: beta-N-acetylhexosaminidase [Alphaproteobacteria bacterium]|nr:beta-N-acetylhexosaminidase [Alphaproteobacteria bacterium]